MGSKIRMKNRPKDSGFFFCLNCFKMTALKKAPPKITGRTHLPLIGQFLE